MSATITRLDKFKETRSLPSDNAAALALGIHRATVSGWRKRGTQAEPHVIAQLAAAIGEEPGAWLALVESQRARSDADRKAWAAVARRLGAAAAVAVVALFPLHEASAAATLTDGPVMHYAKLRMAMIRAARALHRALSRLKDAGRGLDAPALLA